eukprot:TRINITY_DN1788_c0_g1_i9.p1 TRINITY_DN1788_c0_g1~~TRINITY_DN1788_c0_g1_i9.p1  ORF type:complete len:160 (-),score=33.98 TRINITY_DN1788_c0_g1_i9:17-496(-)
MCIRDRVEKVVEDVEVQPGDSIEITVVDPSGGNWTFSAEQKDGSDLPAFFSFTNLTLSGVIPEDHTTDIFIVVTGTDDDGDVRIEYDYSFLFGLGNDGADGDGGDGGNDDISPIIWLIPVVIFICLVVVCLVIVIGLIVGIYKRKSMKAKLRSMAGQSQ